MTCEKEEKEKEEVIYTELTRGKKNIKKERKVGKKKEL